MLPRQGHATRRPRPCRGGALLIVAATLALTPAGATTVERRISHPDGASLLIRSVELHADSIVLRVTIANSGDRDIRLNAEHHFVMTDDAHGVHRLNPPAENPELRVRAQAQASGDLVFIGPLASTARALTVSSNDGIGTPDNPRDDTPLLRATFPAPSGADAAVAQANHPDGVALRVERVAVRPDGCTVSLLATNGNDRAIRLAEHGAVQLIDEKDTTASIETPADNPELTIPASYRLTARLHSACQGLDSAAGLTLATNRGIGATPDNPFETSPVMTIRLRPTATADPAIGKSSAETRPIAASRLSGLTAIAATTDPAAGAPPPPAPAAAASPPAKPPPSPPPAAPVLAPATTAAPPAAAPLPPALPSAKPPPSPSSATPTSPPEPAASTPKPPRTLAQLKVALHAETDDGTVSVVLPTDGLFGPTGDTLSPQAAGALADLSELIEAAHPRDVMVAGNTDSSGNDDDNQALSDSRAKAVAAWLTEHGGRHLPHLTEKGYGRTRPVAPNHNADGSDNPEGRAKNRRIEITLHR